MRLASSFAATFAVVALAGCPTFTSQDEPSFQPPPSEEVPAAHAAGDQAAPPPVVHNAPPPPPAAPPTPPGPPPGAPPVPEDVAAAPRTAQHTASGISYRVLHPGTGTRHPTAASNVEVHYSGWTTDGHMFDSSVARGQPARFSLGGVIPGWTEGVQLMVEGEKVRFWIPGNLAYDQPGVPARPGVPHGTLVFDVELLHIAN